VQQLYKSTDDMFNKMADMKSKIESQEDQLRGISSQASEITKMQALVEQGVSKGIEEVINLQISTATLEQQMNSSIQFEVLRLPRTTDSISVDYVVRPAAPADGRSRQTRGAREVQSATSRIALPS